MQSETFKSLQIVVKLLAQARQDWWLIGGAAFYAHGVGSGNLKDIDVLIGNGDAKRMEQAPGMRLLERNQNELFHSSHYFIHDTEAVPVEFMANLKVRKNDEWQLLAPKTRVLKTIDNIEVYVPDTMELIEIAQLFGRKKDLSRAKQLSAPKLGQ